MYAAERVATSSRDWSVLPEDEIIDQATDLPEQFTLNMAVAHPLEDRAEFGVWLRNVTRVLQELGLEKLIDIQIARPFRQSANAKRWLEFSRKIQHWLTQNMADKLIEEIASTSKGARIQLADEFIEQAKKTFQSPGVYADMAGVASFMSMNVSSYVSAYEFVWGFKKEFHNLWDKQGVQIPPYFAICLLLNRLDTTENRHVVASTISELTARGSQGELWSKFSNVDFHVTAFNIIQRLEKSGSVAMMPVMATPVGPEAPKSFTSFNAVHPTHGVKNFPPPGISEEEYAENLRQSLPQITMDKNCAYCGQKYHIASKCYYLNPDSRPYYWRPLDGIWTYKKGQYGGTKSDENTPFMGWQVNSPLVDSPNRANSPDLAIDPHPPKPVLAQTPDQTPDQTPVPTPTVNEIKEDGDEQEDNKERKEGLDSASEDKPAEENLTEAKSKQTTDWSSFEGTPFDERLEFNKTKDDWLIFNSGHSAHICANRELFIDYHEYGPDEEPATWVWISEDSRDRKGRAVAKGEGRVRVRVDYNNNETEPLVFNAYYYPEARFNIFFAENAVKDHKLQYDEKCGTFLDMELDMKPLGGIVGDCGFHFLRLSDEDY